MKELNTALNLAMPDEIYEQLIRMHDGLSDEESMRANARLILILINHVGDRNVILEAIAAAAATNQLRRGKSK